MHIWDFEQASEQARALAREGDCPFCEVELTDLSLDAIRDAHRLRGGTRISACQECGWANAHQTTTLSMHTATYEREFGSAACLRRFLDAESLNALPLNELRTALRHDYERRNELQPCRFEEIVAHLYRDQGYEVVLTNYRGDDGIDMFLQDVAGDFTALQAKRYKGSVKVDVIRELVGAMVLDGRPKRGIVATTSRFQSGAVGYVERYDRQGYDIELVDGDRLFDFLKIRRRGFYSPDEPFDATQLVDSLGFLEEFEVFTWPRRERRRVSS